MKIITPYPKQRLNPAMALAGFIHRTYLNYNPTNL